MNKYILLFHSIVLMTLSVSAQHHGNYASSIGLNAGWVEDGYGIAGTYNYHTSRTQYAQLNLFVAIAEDKGTFNIPYNIFSAQLGYYSKIWEQRSFKNFALNVGGGALLGFESINNGDNTLETGAEINAESKFIYGLFVGLEGEIILGNEITVIIKANEYYHINSDIGEFYPYAGLGLRYYLF